MKIRLHTDDSARFGVDEIVDFDASRISLREAAELQRVTGLSPADFDQQLQSQNLTALLALVWLAVGRAAGKRPPWDSFDVRFVTIDDDPEPEGKDQSTPATTSEP